jgi:Tfp pilus assembly protein PilF
LYLQKGDAKKALEQLTKALEIAPDNVAALLTRARVYNELKETDKSLADIDGAIKAQPALAMPYLMKADILATSNRLNEAIAGLEKLVKSAPGNEQLLTQLSSFYLMANKPRKAIEAANTILEKDPENFNALRMRADAYLSIGKHAEAIADFGKAIAQKDDDESLNNNFAWVLATSPDDKLRDGTKALKLATKAAESSKYETPHILSTLAAAYAETGDYDNAVKWSQKSVDLAQKEVDSAKADDDKSKMEADRDQLKKELDSYHDHKPVRERQTAEDAPDAPTTKDHAVTPTAAATPAKKSDL